MTFSVICAPQKVIHYRCHRVLISANEPAQLRHQCTILAYYAPVRADSRKPIWLLMAELHNCFHNKIEMHLCKQGRENKTGRGKQEANC